MSSSYPLPLIDLLRIALWAFEQEQSRLGTEKAKRIDYLRELIAANEPGSCAAHEKLDSLTGTAAMPYEPHIDVLQILKATLSLLEKY